MKVKSQAELTEENLKLIESNRVMMEALEEIAKREIIETDDPFPTLCKFLGLAKTALSTAFKLTGGK